MKLARIGGYIRKRYAPTRKWSWEVLLSWLKWHDDRGLVSIVVDEKGNLTGVGIVRCLKESNEGYEHYIHHEEGNVFFAELVVGRDLDDIRILTARFLERFSIRPLIAFKKYHARGNEIFTYETTKYLRRIYGRRR